MADIEKLFYDFEKEYLPKIFGFCIIKMNNNTEAEELAQEISLQVIRTLRSGKKIENMNALIWKISNYTFCKYLRRKKYGSGEYLPETILSETNIEDEFIKREQISILRRELSFMSEKYRRVIVMYYYYEKSCSEIACKLNVSSGTVKWWLHEARNQIKEGMNIMRDYGDKSYNPGMLSLSCQCMPGADNEPMSCVRSKSTQNILLAAYKEAVTVQELCTELGISAPYIEDDVNYLVRNQLLKEVSSGKYQTDFVILPGNNTDTAVELYESCFPEYYNKLISHIERYKDTLISANFNTAAFSWNRLLWVYIHIITDIALCKFKNDVCRIVSCDDIPDRPNGGKWIALGFDNSYFSDIKNSSGIQKEYIPFDGPVHKITDGIFAQGFFHYWSGLDSSVFFNLPDNIFTLCGKIIKGELDLKSMDKEEEYMFSVAVKNKLIVKCDTEFKQNYYFIGSNSKKQIERIAFEFYGNAYPLFQKAWTQILDKYSSSIPKHLHWQMGNFLSNYLNSFVTCSLYDGMKNNILYIPDENNREWLSLFVADM